MSDEVQDHRLSVIEGRLDKHEEMLAQLVNRKTLIKWMMGIGTSMVTVLLAGTQVM